MLWGALNVTQELPQMWLREQQLVAEGHVLGHLEGAGCLSLVKPNLNSAAHGWCLCSALYCDQVSVDSSGSVGT